MRLEMRRTPRGCGLPLVEAPAPPHVKSRAQIRDLGRCGAPFGVVRVHLRVEIRISSRQRPRAPEATERRIAPGRRSAPCPSQEGVLEPASG